MPRVKFTAEQIIGKLCETEVRSPESRESRAAPGRDISGGEFPRL